MIYISIFGIVILIIGLILSFIFARKQQKHEIDKSMSATTYRHRILANPGLIAYASIAVVGIIVVGYFALYYSK